IVNLFIFSPLYRVIKKPLHIRLSCSGVFFPLASGGSPAGFFCVDYLINSRPFLPIVFRIR
ncbi:hypothetical protein, partial [Thiolapillus sp.]